MTNRINKAQAAWKRMVALAAVLLMTGALQAAPTVVNGSFSDNFSSYAQTACMTDGASFGVWSVPFSGYGCVSLGGSYVQLSPQASTSAGTTHAALAVGPSFTNPMTFSVDVKTVAQLRTGSAPNPWEVGWVYWDYTDNTHFYYFQAKPNGWELGKEDPSYAGAQRFLATGSSPVFPLGATYSVKVVQTGTNAFSVYVNGQLITSFTDTQTPYTSGSIALYCEDSSVQFTNVSVNGGTSSSGGGVGTGTTTPSGSAAATISSLSPAALPAGSAGLNLTINGTGFTSGSVVYWNGTALKTFLQSSTILLGWIPTTSLASAGTANVTVQTSGAPASSPAAFTITGAVASNPPPTPTPTPTPIAAATISSLSPATLAAGSAGLNLTVNGAGFQSGSVVYWNGTALKTFYQSPTVLLGWIATTQLASAGTANVTVQTSGTSASTPAAFTITGTVVNTPPPAPSVSAPVISALSPSSLKTGSAAQNLIVNGKGFTSGSVIYWNGAPLKTFVQSPTILYGWITTSDLSSKGQATVTVDTPGAAASSPATFTKS